MAITIKSLRNGSYTAANTDANFYPASAGTFAQKSALVKNIRFVNTGSSSATVLLKVKQDTPTATRQLTPTITIPPNACLVIDDEVTLQGNTNSGTLRQAILITSTGSIDYVISGFERD